MTDFASTSSPRHCIRGAIGFGAFAGAIALIPVIGLLSSLLAPIGLLALRGCPTCWTIGLIQTISKRPPPTHLHRWPLHAHPCLLNNKLPGLSRQVANARVRWWSA